MTKKEQLIEWLKKRADIDTIAEEYISFIMEEYKNFETETETETPDVSWLWHCSTREQNVLDYSMLIDDDNVVPALNRAAQNGFRGCLRRLEDLEIIKMADIDRDINRDDQSQFDIAFGEDELR